MGKFFFFSGAITTGIGIGALGAGDLRVAAACGFILLAIGLSALIVLTKKGE